MTASVMYQTIITESKDQIFYITINREDKLNALNIQTLSEIKNAVLSIYDDASVRGVIITGKGTKAFAAGADIKVN
jgi:enoyl-CoA hydratase